MARPGRRRALVLAGLALTLGGLAASHVASREAAHERRPGPPVSVVVARRDLPAGKAISASALATRAVPARFAPRGALSDPREVAGQRTAAAIPAGADVTITALEDPSRAAAGAPVRPGERVADVVATGPPELVVPGARVDVLVTREARPGARGETRLALEDVEVLAAVPAPQTDGGSARVAASLRVTLRQAVFLAAAQGFARELRLLPRPAADRRRGGSGLAYGEGLG
jgi:pilus assembly protein CpaB